MSKVTGTLDCWYVEEYSDDRYIIWGACINDIHGRFYDRQHIHTSYIEKKDFPIDGLKEGLIVKTRNSTYLLGVKLEMKS